MKALDQLVLGMTFLGIACAQGSGNLTFAAIQALCTAVYFLAEPAVEIWSVIRHRKS